MNLELKLNEEFKEYLVERSLVKLNEGVQYKFRFTNGYGASVVKHDFSYGNEKDLWELAVIQWLNNQKWILCYDTTITDDVIGNLNDYEVNDLLFKIRAL